MNKIFISYQQQQKDVAYNLVSILESNGHPCWIAPRDVVLSYAGDIVDAISTCNVFVILIDDECIKSVHVLNEIEQAYKYYREKKLIIVPIKLKDVPFSKDFDYYLARIQYIPAFDMDIASTAKEIIKKITIQYEEYNKNVAATTNAPETIRGDEEVRLANRYYDVDDKYEKRRLIVEGEVLYRFEKKVFDDLTNDKENMNGLIACCMAPKPIMNKLNLSKFNKLMGLCYNEKAVFEANYDYRNDTTCFFNLDCEDPDFEEKLKELMDKMGIDKFDYVDITMGFLDWKNPFKVIKTLSRFMNPDCRVFVRDVDDGVVMCYPDEGKLFKHFKTLYPLDPISGYRKSGRRIYSYFKKIKAKEINLVHSGIDMSDMNEEDKEKMFFAWFGFIPNDFKISVNEHPEIQDYRDAVKWCEENYDELEEAFMDNSFFFNSGYFIFAIKM